MLDNLSFDQVVLLVRRSADLERPPKANDKPRTAQEMVEAGDTDELVDEIAAIKRRYKDAM